MLLTNVDATAIPNLYRLPAPVALRDPRYNTGTSLADYDPTDHPDEIRQAFSDAEYAKHRIGVHVAGLHRGYIFRVVYDSRNGVILISLPDLMPASRFYIVKIAEFDSDPSLKCITRACGELLERHHLARGRFNADEWHQAQAKYARQARGIFDWEYDRVRNRFIKKIPEELVR